MSPLLVILGWLWALPTTLVGVLLGFIGGARPAHTSGPECAWVWHVEGGLLGWLFSAVALPGGHIGAQTIGAVILIRPDCDPRLLTHERCHVRQAFALGPLYLPVYLVSWLLAGCSYADNWMERQARAAAGES